MFDFTIIDGLLFPSYQNKLMHLVEQFQLFVIYKILVTFFVLFSINNL